MWTLYFRFVFLSGLRKWSFKFWSRDFFREVKNRFLANKKKETDKQTKITFVMLNVIAMAKGGFKCKKSFLWVTQYGNSKTHDIYNIILPDIVVCSILLLTLLPMLIIILGAGHTIL